MAQSAPASIEDGVIDVLKKVSRRPIRPTLDSDLVTDLGFDSLQVLELIAELEDRFDISIPLNEVPATRTVAHVVAQVTALVEGRAIRGWPAPAPCPRGSPKPRRVKQATYWSLPAGRPGDPTRRSTRRRGASRARCGPWASATAIWS